MKVIEKIVHTTVEETTVVVETDPKPKRVQPKLRAAPKIRQLHWCDFPEDAHLPEFWKRRPVVILSYRNTLSGAVTVVPCSSQSQDGNAWALPLKVTIDGTSSWAVCDKVTTVAVSRLSPAKGAIPRLGEDEFDALVALVLKWLPVPSG